MKGMNVVAKTITRVTFVPALTFAIYLILHGHVSHGAGFAGGVIIALCLFQAMLAFGKTEPLRSSGVLTCRLTGALMLLFLIALGMLGYSSGAGFGGNFLGKGTPFSLLSGGMIVIANAALCISAAASLFIVFVRFASYRHSGTDDPAAGEDD